MTGTIPPAHRSLRRTPLAVCLGVALALGVGTPALGDPPTAPAPTAAPLLPGMPSMLRRKHALQISRTTGAHAGDPTAAADDPPRPAATIVVANCNDSGPGSLRTSIAGAASGDTIDLSALACSRITLTTGAITIGQNDLSLVGPGALQLAVDGGLGSGYLDRVFDHTGTGTLDIAYLTITDATYATYAPGGQAKGGCIRSAGNVGLVLSVVSSCRVAQSGNNESLGGGLYVAGNLSLIASLVQGNVAYSSQYYGIGGGATVGGALTAKYSAISNNTSTTLGGGIFVIDSTDAGSVVDKSTLAGNRSNEVGAIVLTGPSTVRDSTISGNRGDFVIGGIYGSAPLDLLNSTVAFNQAAAASVMLGIVDVGVAMGYASVNLQSTIVSNNYVDLAETPRDISATGTGASIAGNSNMVTHADTPMPADTLYADPLLYPLAMNGGLTRTHALQPGSPAIDAGNNSAGLVYDQRLLPRVVGANADIGAFERQGPNDSDFIFVDGFDG